MKTPDSANLLAAGVDLSAGMEVACAAITVRLPRTPSPGRRTPSASGRLTAGLPAPAYATVPEHVVSQSLEEEDNGDQRALL